MLAPEIIDQIVDRLERILPAGSFGFADEIRRNVTVLLQDSLSRLDLVSRDEFDTQAAVLAHTREKLEAMEGRVRELEELLREMPQDSD